MFARRCCRDCSATHLRQSDYEVIFVGKLRSKSHRAAVTLLFLSVCRFSTCSQVFSTLTNLAGDASVAEVLVSKGLLCDAHDAAGGFSGRIPLGIFIVTWHIGKGGLIAAVLVQRVHQGKEEAAALLMMLFEVLAGCMSSPEGFNARHGMGASLTDVL